VNCFGVHFALGLKRGSNQAAPPLVRELMALNPRCLPREREGRPSFWGATEPHAARPGRNPQRGRC
jgi:hypothetical protein